MKFDILDIFFLPMLFLICIVTSYQDFKYGKIKNKWILFGLLWGTGVYLLIAILNLTGFANILFPVLASVLANDLFQGSWLNLLKYSFLNSFCALLLGYLLWYFKLWAAGDAKLFFVISLLLPLKYYFEHYIIIFPSAALFINTILILFLVMLFSIFLNSIKIARDKSLKPLFKKNFLEIKKQWKPILIIFLLLVFIFLSVEIITGMFKTYFSLNKTIFTLIVCLGLLVFMRSLANFLNRHFKTIISCFVLFLFIIFAFFPGKISFIQHFILRMLLMFVLIFGIFNIVPRLFEGGTSPKYMSFAVYMFMGTLLTIFCGGSVLSLFL